MLCPTAGKPTFCLSFGLPGSQLFRLRLESTPSIRQLSCLEAIPQALLGSTLEMAGCGISQPAQLHGATPLKNPDQCTQKCL